MAVFGEALATAAAYAELLARVGIQRGLLGPREVSRLWDRHLLNCAVLADGIPDGSEVADVGSGAGLPGIPLAIRRSDVQVTLIEPLQRRAAFLTEAVSALELRNVAILRERAEALHDRRQYDVVTSRAVAPLGRLLTWCLPLTRPGGYVLAIKGASAVEEVAQLGRLVASLDASAPEVVHLGTDTLTVPTTVVRVRAGAPSRLPSLPRRSAPPERRSRRGGS